MNKMHGMSRRVGSISVVLVAAFLLAAVGASRADNPMGLPIACVAQGPLIVNQANEVHFSASGICGAYRVSFGDQSDDPLSYPPHYPHFGGGCGYGPGPFPSLRIGISFTDLATGAEAGYRETWWSFPQLVVGAGRFVAPNSATTLTIRDILAIGYHDERLSGVVGRGVLLTRLGGSCNVNNAKTANSTVVFTIYGQIPSNV